MNTEIDLKAWNQVWQRVMDSGTGETKEVKPVYSMDSLLCEKLDSIGFWQNCFSRGVLPWQECRRLYMQKRNQLQKLQGWYYLRKGSLPVCRKQSSTEKSMLLCLRQQIMQEKKWSDYLHQCSLETADEEEKKDLRCAAREDAAHAEMIRKMLFRQLSCQCPKEPGPKD